MAKFNGLNGKGKTTKIFLSSLLLSLAIYETCHAQPPAPATKPPAARTGSNLPPPPKPPTTEPSTEVEESSTEPNETESPTPINPDDVKADPNPLNPTGDSLDTLIKMRMDDDLWRSMLGDLPCLEATDDCIARLQGLAVQNSRELKAIDQRIEAINQKVNEAKANNQKSVRLGVFEPLLQSFLKLEEVPAQPGQQPQKRGFLNKVFDIFVRPVSGLNEILSLVGLPLFRNASGGDAAAQSRVIALGDLQIKLAEIENKRGDLAAKIRETVITQVLDYDQTRREFQLSQEIASRASLRLKLIEVDYHFAAEGSSNTEGYLNQVSGVDQRKADSFRHWAGLRSQMARIKLLVLGAGED